MTNVVTHNWQKCKESMSEEFSTINITSVSYSFPPGSREQLRKAGRKTVRTGGQGGSG